MKIRALMLCLLGLTGCAQFQSTSEIRLGSASFSLPKDFRGDYMHIKIPMVLTNGMTGTADLVMTNFVIKMNPEVLDKATQHDVAIINAAGTQAANLIGQAVEAAAKGAKP